MIDITEKNYELYYREKGNPDAPWKEADLETEEMIRKNIEKYETWGRADGGFFMNHFFHINDQGEDEQDFVE